MVAGDESMDVLSLVLDFLEDWEEEEVKNPPPPPLAGEALLGGCEEGVCFVGWSDGDEEDDDGTLPFEIASSCCELLEGNAAGNPS